MDDYELLTKIALRLNDLERRLKALETKESVVTLAVYGMTTAQDFNSGAITVVNYNSAIYDPMGLVTPGANWLFTCPVAGVYWVNAHLQFASSTNWATGEVSYLRVNLTGNLYSYLDYKNNWNSGGVAIYARLAGTTLVKCSKGDNLQFAAYQASGAALAAYAPFSSNDFTHCSIAYVRGA